MHCNVSYICMKKDINMHEYWFIWLGTRHDWLGPCPTIPNLATLSNGQLSYQCSVPYAYLAHTCSYGSSLMRKGNFS